MKVASRFPTLPLLAQRKWHLSKETCPIPALTLILIPIPALPLLRLRLRRPTSAILIRNKSQIALAPYNPAHGVSWE
jgi:hypothetical protein